jgi:transposase
MGRYKLLFKGFFPEIVVQDFTIRKHQVFLHLRRRRWLNVETSKVIYRNCTLVGKGTRMTVDSRLSQKRSINTVPNTVNSISSFYSVKAKNLLRQYRNYLGDFKTWEQKYHARKWLLYPKISAKIFPLMRPVYTTVIMISLLRCS